MEQVNTAVTDRRIELMFETQARLDQNASIRSWRCCEVDTLQTLGLRWRGSSCYALTGGSHVTHAGVGGDARRVRFQHENAATHRHRPGPLRGRMDHRRWRAGLHRRRLLDATNGSLWRQAGTVDSSGLGGGP